MFNKKIDIPDIDYKKCSDIFFNEYDIFNEYNIFMHSLKNSIDITNLEFRSGSNALHFCALSGDADLFTMILDKNPEFAVSFNLSGLTPIMVASIFEKVDILKAARGKVDFNVKDQLGRTALHYAATSTNIIRAFENNNTNDLNQHKDMFVFSIDDFTNALISQENFKILVDCGAKTNIRDIFGETPADLARSIALQEYHNFLTR